MSSTRIPYAFFLAFLCCSTTLFAQRRESRRAPLESVALELGAVQSSEAVDIRSPLQASILALAPEGVAVKKGDLLLRLDSSQLEEEYAKQRVIDANARAQVLKTESALQRAKLEGEAGIRKLSLSLDVARLALERFAGKDGEFALRQRTNEARLELAKERLKTAETLRDLAQKKPDAHPGELVKANYQFLEAKVALTEAMAEGRLLRGPAKAHEEAVLKLALVSAELESTKGKAAFEDLQNQALGALEASKVQLQAITAKRDRLEHRIRESVIKAPQDGVVIYAKPGTRSGAVIEEGAMVRERQTVMRLVNPKTLQLRVLVHESRISRVKVGQPVKIRLDAFPDRVFRGKVVKTATYPEPSSFLTRSVKNYAVLVSIADPGEGLRIGLTAAAEIDLSK